MHRQRTFLSQTSSAKSNTSKSGSPEPIHPYDELDMDLDRDLSQSQSSLPPLVNKLRNRLSLKSTRAAFAEREILKRENRAARPLTQRNVDTFVIEQDLNDARVRRAENLHVSQWLQNLP